MGKAKSSGGSPERKIDPKKDSERARKVDKALYDKYGAGPGTFKPAPRRGFGSK